MMSKRKGRMYNGGNYDVLRKWMEKGGHYDVQVKRVDGQGRTYDWMALWCELKNWMQKQAL